MATLFEQYAPYRQPLTGEERQMLDRAAQYQQEITSDPGLERWERGWIDGDGQRVPYPLQQAQMRIALDRAAIQMQDWNARGVIYPDSPEIAERFPGVDPRGKCCEVDMAFSDRLAKLQAALPTRPPEVQAYVGGLLRDAGSLRTPVGRVWDEMRNDCINIRVKQRAAKLAVTEETSRWLQEDIQSSVTGSAPIQRVNGLLNTLEYACGLTDRPPTAQETALMTGALHAPVPESVLAVRTAPAAPPDRLQVEFENFDHQTQQKFFSNPRNWGKSPADVPEDVVNLDAAAGAVSRYAAATADRTIDPAFAQAEKNSDGFLSRGDLITVDGKTVREIIAEGYQPRNPEDNFDRYYADNVRQMTASIVSAGLMAGKRVEAFLPDSRGRIPQEPTQITKAGYEPSPLKKVTLNAWERHFAKHGFYKEKAAKAVEYQRCMAARERVKAANMRAQFSMDGGASRPMKEMFFGQWMRENGPIPTSVPHGFSATRSALTTFATCVMAREGHRVEDILDPTKLTAEKQAVGKQVMERILAGDGQWASETLFHGNRALNQQMDRLAGAMDITDERQLFSPAARPLAFAASTVFDIGQEENHIKAEMLAAAERFAPGRGKAALDEVFHTGDNLAGYMDSAKASLSGRVNLSSGTVIKAEVTRAAIPVFKFEYGRRLFAQAKAASPDAPASSLVPHDAWRITGEALMGNSSFRSLVGRLEESRPLQMSMGREALSGQLQQRTKLGVDMKRFKASFDIEPSKQVEKQRERTETLEQAVAKNARRQPQKQPPAHGGMHR